MNKVIKTLMVVLALAVSVEMVVLLHQTKRIEKAVELLRPPKPTPADSVGMSGTEIPRH